MYETLGLRMVQLDSGCGLSSGFQLKEGLLRIHKFKKNMKCNGVDVLMMAWKTKHEKLQQFISQEFSLRKGEITGIETNFEEVSSKVTLSAVIE